jgi:RNA polymerase sigma factor (sigma-70 family)
MASLPLASMFRRLFRCVAPTDDAAPDDADLLARFVAWRDEAAFAALVARHGPLVWGVCRRVLGHVHDAEDAFQATFFVLARKAASVRRRGALGGWLYRVAHRLAARVRAAAARRRDPTPQGEQAMTTADPAAELARQELVAALDDELMGLPERDRLPLVLHYLQGKTHRETAQALGCPVGSVSARVARGLSRLRARLERRGLTSACLSAALATGATVPPALAEATVAGALGFVGASSAVPVSGPAALLAQGALQSMFVSRLKLPAVLVLLGGLFAGASLLAGPGAPTPADAPPAARPAPQPAAPVNWKARLSVQTNAPDELHALWAALAFSPDGRLLALRNGSHRNGGDVRFLDPATGKVQGTADSPLGDSHVFTFVGKGERFAASDPDGLTLWTVPGGKKQARLPWGAPAAPGLDNPLGTAGAGARASTAAALAADAGTLAVGWHDGGVELWKLDAFWARRLAPKQAARKLTGPASAVARLAFGPGARRLAVAHRDGGVTVWEAATGKRLATFKGEARPAAPPREVRFDPVTGKLGPLELPAELFVIPVGLSFAADGRTLAIVDSRGLRLVEVASQKEVARVAWGKGGKRASHLVVAAAFSPDRKAVALGRGDGVVELWDLAAVWDEGRAAARLLASFKGARDDLPAPIQALAFARDGRSLASCCGLGTLKVWQAVAQPR